VPNIHVEGHLVHTHGQQTETDKLTDATETVARRRRVIDAAAVRAQQRLCNGSASVRPSVCPVDRQQQRRPAGLLLSALQISIDSCGCAAGAGAVLQLGRGPAARRRRSAADAAASRRYDTIPYEMLY